MKERFMISGITNPELTLGKPWEKMKMLYFSKNNPFIYQNGSGFMDLPIWIDK